LCSGYRERQRAADDAREAAYAAIARARREHRDLTVREIAAATGLSHQRIHQITQEHRDAR